MMILRSPVGRFVIEGWHGIVAIISGGMLSVALSFLNGDITSLLDGTRLMHDFEHGMVATFVAVFLRPFIRQYAPRVDEAFPAPPTEPGVSPK